MSKLTQTLPSSVWSGRGTACLISGYVSGKQKLKKFSVEGLGLNSSTMLHLAHDEIDQCCNDEKPESSYASGFTSLIKFPATVSSTFSSLTVDMLAEFSNGEKEKIETLSISCPANSAIEKIRLPTTKVVICMACWEPDEKKLKRQVESIKAQTLTDWHCIINDDASSEAAWERYQPIIGDDQRFSLYRNTKNQGFYRNFEIALLRVPDNTEFIALADQDDDWYPEKLAATLAQFETDIMLVYSDMRIVGEQGSVISDSYWKRRKNNYQDADVLFLANTVTGAASIFRRELLADILPFPQAVGQVFHDHWIACVARCKGALAYVDQPLYDYYQYGNSVIGQCDFEARGVAKRVVDLAANVKHLGKLAKLKSWIIHKRFSALNVFYQEYLRLYLFAEILKMRQPDMNSEAAAGLRMFQAGWASIYYLLKSHIRIMTKKETTDDAEVRLAAAVLVFKLDQFFGNIFAGRIIKKHCQSLQNRSDI